MHLNRVFQMHDYLIPKRFIINEGFKVISSASHFDF